MSRTYGARGPLSHILREKIEVPDEDEDPLGTHPTRNYITSYYGRSVSLQEELITRLPHSGPIYCNDNKTVFLKIEGTVRRTSVESTIKSFSRTKNGRATYLALLSNHAGDTKYRSISEKRLNLLYNIKWNGRNYPLESHVSNHWQAFDDLTECDNYITVPVPTEPQRVEFLIDSITSSDNTIQATIGLIRANANDMRNNFELAASTLIKVDPYRRSQRAVKTFRTANISSLNFSA